MTIRRNIVDSLAIPHRRDLSPVRLKQWASQVESGVHYTGREAPVLDNS